LRLSFFAFFFAFALAAFFFAAFSSGEDSSSLLSEDSSSSSSSWFFRPRAFFLFFSFSFFAFALAFRFRFFLSSYESEDSESESSESDSSELELSEDDDDEDSLSLLEGSLPRLDLDLSPFAAFRDEASSCLCFLQAAFLDVVSGVLGLVAFFTSVFEAVFSAGGSASCLVSKPSALVDDWLASSAMPERRSVVRSWL
jgi:hypothetical protein